MKVQIASRPEMFMVYCKNTHGRRLHLSQRVHIENRVFMTPSWSIVLNHDNDLCAIPKENLTSTSFMAVLQTSIFNMVRERGRTHKDFHKAHGQFY
jgi:hypothetical protein